MKTKKEVIQISYSSLSSFILLSSHFISFSSTKKNISFYHNKNCFYENKINTMCELSCTTRYGGIASSQECPSSLILVLVTVISYSWSLKFTYCSKLFSHSLWMTFNFIALFCEHHFLLVMMNARLYKAISYLNAVWGAAPWWWVWFQRLL